MLNTMLILMLKMLNLKSCKYKNVFPKGYAPNWSEEVLVIKKDKILFHGHTLLSPSYETLRVCGAT